jgi:hypothetical protein
MRIFCRSLRITLGAAFWVAVSVWVFRLSRAEPEVVQQITDYFRREDLVIDVEFTHPVLLEVGDPAYLAGVEEKPVGYVWTLLNGDGKPTPSLQAWVRRARIHIFDRMHAGLREDATARLVRVPDMAFGWVRETLIPPEKLERISEEVVTAWRRHRDEIFARLRPLVVEFLQEAEREAEAEFRRFLDRHREEIQKLMRKVETEFGAEKLTKLFEAEVWPIIQRRLKPVTDEIGTEIWNQFPLWGLSWRLAFQSLPLTRDDYFQRRWDLFIEDEVVPILRSHSREFFSLSRDVAR